MSKNKDHSITDCIDAANKALAERNTEIDFSKLVKTTINTVTLDLGYGVFIPTTKLNAKIKGKAVSVFAPYCPLCGAKL